MADVLALHGFTQRGAMWDEVAAMAGGEWVTPDLPGHGTTPLMDWGSAVSWLVAQVEAAGPGVTLAGYSMGGRLALAAALEQPEGLARLVVMAASPGIADPGARARRQAADEQTAERIERLGIDLFLTEWLANPMFSGLGRRPAAWGSRDLRMRLSNDPAGLAGAVRLLGQGSQPHLGNRIGELRVPLVTVAGSRDEVYLAHAGRMAAAAADGRCVEVGGAGHALVGEDPKAIARVLAS
ncbi:MAG: alpha/beta fold hydrolase [Actinobacteria bacterium]|nr:alpha/beta fold hydrolase [Actinomycetota bacterium]MBU1494713.1 alpha/beta fold hydrolase [Actinomycetota bacterium]